jgi:N-acetylmuramoyl-L-alanine amidase
MNKLTKINFTKIKIFIFLMMIILSTVIMPFKVSALADKEFFKRNDILFYDPDACGATDGSDASGAVNGNVVAIGDSLLANDKQVGKLEDKLKAKKYTDITIDAQVSRFIDGGSVPSGLQAIETNKEKISAAGTIIVVLGTNYPGSKAPFDADFKKFMTNIRDLNKETRIFWVNIVNEGAPESANGANSVIEDADNKKTFNYSIVDWHKAVYANGQADESLLSMSDGGYHQSNPKGINKHVELIIGAIGEPTTGGGLSGKNNKEKAWCFFRSKGLSKQATAGILGNFMIESPGIIPNNWQGGTCPPTPGTVYSSNSCGYGIAQWSWNDRKIALWDFAGEKPYDTSGKVATLELQLNFAYKDLSTSNYPPTVKAWNVLKPGKTPTVYDAAKEFMIGYEAPADKSENAAKNRESEGNKLLAEFGNKACGSSTNTSTSAEATTGGQTIIAIDPGHTGSNDPSHDYLDPATGILDTIGNNGKETTDVYKVATTVKDLLTADNYSVILTKNGPQDSPNSRARAETVNKAEADLAFSIHYDSAHQFGNWGQVYAQEQGLYRFKGMDGLGPEKVAFDNKEIADKSIEYANKFVTSRKANEGGPITRTTNNTFTNRAKEQPGYIAGGNIPLVQLWSDVPWVYNESGAPSDGMTDNQIKEYAKGLYEGVKKSIGPNEHKGSNTVDDGCGTTKSVNPEGVAAIVQIAKQEFNKHPQEYDSDVLKYTDGGTFAWCASFASWVYKEAGYPLTKGGVPWLHTTVTDLIAYFKKNETYIDYGEQDPQPGDMIYYGNQEDPDVTKGDTPDGMAHVAIVESWDASSKTITTIGGNESGTTIMNRTFKIEGNGNATAAMSMWVAGFGRIKQP